MRKKVKIIAMIVNVYCTNGYIVYSPFESSRYLKYSLAATTACVNPHWVLAFMYSLTFSVS